MDFVSCDGDGFVPPDFIKLIQFTFISKTYHKSETSRIL